MKTALFALLSVTVALWLGGLASLFLFAQSLFNADRALAVRAAPVLFDVFAPYQGLLAVVAVLTAGAWWAAARQPAAGWTAGLIAVAALGAAAVALYIVPRMEAIRLAGESGSDAFKRLHGASMAVFLAESVALLIVAVLLATTGHRPRSPLTPPAGSRPAELLAASPSAR